MTQAAKEERVAPHAVAKYLLQITIVFVAYFVAGRLGQATTNIRSSNLGPVWPAYGIALAAVLICGYRIWPGVAAGAFLVAFFSPVPHIAAVGQAAGATLAAMTGAFVLRRVVNFHPSLSRLRDALGLIVFGALGSTIVSASIGVSVLYAAHVHAYSGLGSAWLIYWLGDSTGVLLVTPLVLTLPNLFRIRDRNRITELAVLLLLLTAACIVVFADVPLISVKLHFLAFAVLPFVMWAAIHFGMSGATLSILLVATIATVGTALGFGPFAQDTPFTNAVLLDVFFAVLSVSGMTLAAVIAEREQAETDREQLVREQAAMEVRLRLATIVESADDAIIGKDMDGIITDWNRGAEQLYGYAADEVIGKSVSLLIPPDHADDFPEIMQRIRRGERVAHYETVRQKKDGTRVDISLSVSSIRNAAGKIIGAAAIARNISERRLAEDSLRSSEERLRLAQKVARIGSFEWNIQTGVNIWTPELETMYGLQPGGFGKTQSAFENLVHPDDRARVIELTDSALKSGQPAEGEWRVLWGDGSLHWIAGRWQALMNESGEAVRMIGVNIDVTERKQAEEALLGVNRRLIEAQEQERSRIGRELHDDINQRLAMLALELQQLQDNPAEVGSRLQELRKQTTEISNDVQALSHELHSSKLEYLGVVAGTRSWCKEFGERQGMEIEFKSDVASVLPLEVGVCLFRVLQEALHNAVKYSGTKRVEVQLAEHSNEVHLIVHDSGRGFDIEAAQQGRGLGLTSMQERVRLLSGTISFESKPIGGTTIHVRIPFEVGHEAQRVSG